MSNTHMQMTDKQRQGRPRRTEEWTQLLLRMPVVLHDSLRAVARADSIELSAWIRYTCVQELRRRKKAAV